MLGPQLGQVNSRKSLPEGLKISLMQHPRTVAPPRSSAVQLPTLLFGAVFFVAVSPRPFAQCAFWAAAILARGRRRELLGSVCLAEGCQCGSDSAQLSGQAVLFLLQQLDDSNQIGRLNLP
jgi:hypothetical protein